MFNNNPPVSKLAQPAFKAAKTYQEPTHTPQKPKHRTMAQSPGPRPGNMKQTTSLAEARQKRAAL